MAATYFRNGDELTAQSTGIVANSSFPAVPANDSVDMLAVFDCLGLDEVMIQAYGSTNNAHQITLYWCDRNAPTDVLLGPSMTLTDWNKQTGVNMAACEDTSGRWKAEKTIVLKKGDASNPIRRRWLLVSIKAITATTDLLLSIRSSYGGQ